MSAPTVHEGDLVVSLPFHVPFLWRDHGRGDEAFAVEEGWAPMRIRGVPPGAMRTRVVPVFQGSRDYRIDLDFEGRLWQPFTDHTVRRLMAEPVSLRPFRFLDVALPDGMEREPPVSGTRRHGYLRLNAVARTDAKARAWATGMLAGHVVHDGTNLFHSEDPAPGADVDLVESRETLRSNLFEVLVASARLARVAEPGSLMAEDAHQLRRLMLLAMLDAVPRDGMRNAFLLVRETAALVAAAHTAKTVRGTMAGVIADLELSMPPDEHGDEAGLSSLAP